LHPDEYNKPIVPDHTVLYIPFDNIDEAYYVAGVLNSSIIRLVSLYMVTSSIQDLSIPKFNKNNEIHKKIASLAREAHKASNINNTKKLEYIEKELDRYVAKIFNINQKELHVIKKMLEIINE